MDAALNLSLEPALHVHLALNLPLFSRTQRLRGLVDSLGGLVCLQLHRQLLRPPTCQLLRTSDAALGVVLSLSTATGGGGACRGGRGDVGSGARLAGVWREHGRPLCLPPRLGLSEQLVTQFGTLVESGCHLAAARSDRARAGRRFGHSDGRLGHKVRPLEERARRCLCVHSSAGASRALLSRRAVGSRAPCGSYAWTLRKLAIHRKPYVVPFFESRGVQKAVRGHLKEGRADGV